MPPKTSEGSLGSPLLWHVENALGTWAQHSAANSSEPNAFEPPIRSRKRPMLTSKMSHARYSVRDLGSLRKPSNPQRWLWRLVGLFHSGTVIPGTLGARNHPPPICTTNDIDALFAVIIQTPCVGRTSRNFSITDRPASRPFCSSADNGRTSSFTPGASRSGKCLISKSSSLNSGWSFGCSKSRICCASGRFNTFLSPAIISSFAIRTRDSGSFNARLSVPFCKVRVSLFGS